MTLSPGMRVGRYEVASLLGAGGMGEVWLAEDLSLGRRAALKVISQDAVPGTEGWRRLDQEARAASALSHPNVAHVYELLEHDTLRVLAMEYVEGETLRARMRRGAIPMPEALDIALQAAAGLAAAHAAGVVHRDVKPENLMLRPDGWVKVLDFGLARRQPSAAADARSQDLTTRSGTVMGTLGYMPPEQIRGLAVDARADVFALGVVVYEMLAERRPLEGPTPGDTLVAVLTQDARPLSEVNARVSPGLSGLVSRALAKDPASRPPDAAAFAAELEAYAGPRSRGTTAAVRGTRPSRAYEDVPTRVLGKGPTETTARTSRPLPSRARVLLAGGTLALVVVATLALLRESRIRAAHASVASIEALVEKQRLVEAFERAAEVAKVLPADPTLRRLMPRIADDLTVRTDPAGARVYLERFDPDHPERSDRVFLGVSPIEHRSVARADYLVTIEKEGFATAERPFSGSSLPTPVGPYLPPPRLVEAKLLAVGETPAGTVFVPGGDYRLVGSTRPTDARVELAGFFIDRTEVTNRAYKEFVLDGGYQRRELWTHPFMRDGGPVTWEDAMRAFVDTTGQPGPRGWAGQTFPEGKADFPVTGVTWYEAAAYAAYRGRTLPTIFQWQKAARAGATSAYGTAMPWGTLGLGVSIQGRANLGGTGPMPADSLRFGTSPFGCRHMAGNVAEWCWNAMSPGFLTAGGAWDDPVYQFGSYGVRPGFHSSPTIGFRCAVSRAPQEQQGGMPLQPALVKRTFARSTTSDFERWSHVYDYARTPLQATVTDVKTTEEWRRERVSYSGAGGRPAIAYLYLPRGGAPPYQVIHLIPASDVADGYQSLPRSIEAVMPPFLRAGRAVFAVVLEGYIERERRPGWEEPKVHTAEHRDEVVAHVTDLRLGLDWLETRADVDHQRVTGFAPSAGGDLGLVLFALERRYRSVAFMGAGIGEEATRTIDEANAAGFAPHIRVPKLILHGRYDEARPLAEMEALVELMPEPRKVVVFEGGHIPPVPLLIATLSAWFDETLGTVGARPSVEVGK